MTARTLWALAGVVAAALVTLAISILVSLTEAALCGPQRGW
jgi:hypothetical protein